MSRIMIDPIYPHLESSILGDSNIAMRCYEDVTVFIKPVGTPADGTVIPTIFQYLPILSHSFYGFLMGFYGGGGSPWVPSSTNVRFEVGADGMFLKLCCWP